MTVKRRPGRRPGSADTRGEILAAARKEFAEKGFDKATVRGIARQASVDPALVHHYFESKVSMFVEAMRLPINPDVLLPAILAAPREEIGERLVRMILTLFAEDAARQSALGLIRSVMTNEESVAVFRDFMTNVLLYRVADELGVPRLRTEVAFAQMFGVIVARHILRLEPVASAEVDELVELLAPTIQRYLVG